MDNKKLLYVGIGFSVIVGIWAGLALYYKNDKITPDCCEDDECKKD